MLHAKVRRDDLKMAASPAAVVSDSSRILPILGYTTLTAENETLTVSASDLKISFQIRLPAEVLEPGRVAVPAKAFSDFAKSVPDGLVAIREAGGHSVSLSSGAFVTNLLGDSPESFPSFPAIEGFELVSVGGRELADALAKTVYASAPDEDTSNLAQDLNLANVFFLRESEDGIARLRLIASDSMRLNVATLDAAGLERLQMEDPGLLVPNKGASALKALAETVERVDIGLGGDQLVAKTARADLLVELRGGCFPDYHKIIPDLDTLLPAWLSRQELSDSLKRITRRLSRVRPPDVSFIFSSGLLAIAGPDPYKGRAMEIVAADYEGPKIKIFSNPLLLSEALDSMASDKIRLDLMASDKIRLDLMEDNGGLTKTTYLISGPDDPGFCGVFAGSTRL